MKKIKILAAILAVLMSIGFVGCSGAATPGNSSDKELYDIGKQMIGIQDEMVRSEEYKEILGAVAFENVIKSVAEGDYTSPSAVYSVTLPENDELLYLIGRSIAKNWEGLSENLKEQVRELVNFSTLLSYICAQKGTEVMAFRSIYTSYKEFDDLVLDDSKMFLYVFEKGTPIAVIYENGRARAYFAFLGDDNSLEGIQKVFLPYECTVEKLNIK